MTTPIYRIRDWEELYEPETEFVRLSPRDTMKWIAVPTKQDGEGYTKLVTMRHGPAFFGAWLAMLQVAGKCFPRGILIRKDGKPHDALSLSLKSRMPSKLFEMVLPVLANEIAWLEVVTLSQVTEYAEHARSRVYARVRDRAPSFDNTKQDITEPKTKTPRKTAARRPILPVDAEYIAQMQADPLYAPLDCQLVYDIMVRWCQRRGKLPTRRRYGTFLDNQVKDMKANHGETTPRPQRPTASEKRSTKLRSRDYNNLARATLDRDKSHDD